MRITSFINNSKCLEWDLTMQQGALFDLLNQLHTWAEPITIDGDVYYWASKTMICNEIPLAYSKTDTVYRALKLLSKKGLINYKKHGEKDCISLTKKGKEWNSEINPKLGSKSEDTRIQIRNSSDLNPTYKNTNINNTKINNTKEIACDFELIKNAYNDAVENEEFTPVKTINEKRKANIKKLIKQLEYPTEKGLINYLYDFAEKAPDWTRGKTSINFTAHFDYILRPETYIKFIEGSL